MNKCQSGNVHKGKPSSLGQTPHSHCVPPGFTCFHKVVIRPARRPGVIKQTVSQLRGTAQILRENLPSCCQKCRSLKIHAEWFLFLSIPPPGKKTIGFISQVFSFNRREVSMKWAFKSSGSVCFWCSIVPETPTLPSTIKTFQRDSTSLNTDEPPPWLVHKHDHAGDLLPAFY